MQELCASERAFCNWVGSRPVDSHTLNQSSFGTEPRPPLQLGLGSIVWCVPECICCIHTCPKDPHQRGKLTIVRFNHSCACALWLRVASSVSFCARDAHKFFMPLCIGAFGIILPMIIKILLIAFLVCLICYMVLLHYCAVCLKEMYLHFTAYIFLYKYITCFPWMYFTTIQRAIYTIFYQI